MIAPAPRPSPGDGSDPAVDELLHAGRHLPDDVEERVLGLGRAAAAPALIRILESGDLAEADASKGGFAPVHAAALLAALEASEAIEPMLRVLARYDVFDTRYTTLVEALLSLGAPVLEPALAAHAAARLEDRRLAVEDVLAGLGVRDHRILTLLIGSLGRNVERGATLLAEYGDEAALPALGAALDACELDPRGGPFANSELTELAAAIEELGGTLTREQAGKLQEVRAAWRTATEPLRRIGAPDDEEDWPGEEDGPDEEDLDDDGADRALAQFAASPRAADAPSLGWIERMLGYATEHLGTPFSELDGDALEEVVFELFPRKVTCEPAVAREAVQSLRAFWTFARDVLAHPHAEECLQLLGEGAVGRLERELADPSNFGMTKSFAMAGAVPGLHDRLEGPSRRRTSSADRDRKKRKRKQRKQARRRNRR